MSNINMAYAPLSDAFEISGPPPPYSLHEKMNLETQYQFQRPTRGQSLSTTLQPSPFAAIYNQSSSSVVVDPRGVTVVQPVGEFLSHYPQTTKCSSCRQQILTQVRYESGSMTWLIALLVCCFGGFLGCCLIPFCLSSCQDAVHTCPACHDLIGRRSPF